MRVAYVGARRSAALVVLLLGAVAGCGGDDDGPSGMAGVTVEPTSGLRTTEAGGQAMFTVVLTGEPNGEVTIPVESSDEGEGTVSPSSLTFTPDDWDAPQTVTITGVDDEEADGDTEYTIEVGPATSGDTRYEGMDPDDVSVTNDDDETPGVTVEPTEGLTTTEAGGTDTFTVVLDAAPTADVTIALMSGDDTEGTVSPESLTFTPDNWNAPQTVTVTGVDDDEIDGDVAYQILTGDAESTDDGYGALDVPDVEVVNTDDESPGVTIDPVDGLTTTEDGGTATFTIVLNSAPAADVIVGVASSDTGEGTASPDTLTFTVDNWDAPQTVTVTGVDDDLADGDQVYTIITDPLSSDDANYDEFDPADVEVTNTDNDSPGVTVSPTDGLVVTEGGGTDTFTVVLNSEPTADVTFAITSGDTGEGTVSPSSLTFTTANWDAPQTVTVTGVDDDLADGGQVFMVAVGAASSTDAGYDGLDPSDVEVTCTDDDSAGVTVDPTTGLTTTEGGGTATFTVVLNSEPSADVTIGVSSDDTGEGTVSPSSLTFTTANWDAPQTVTVTGVDDSLADGNQPYTIVLAAATSTDSDYDGLDPTDVGVTNTDDDSAGITVTPTSGLTVTEAGGTDTFTIVLNSRPTADVTIDLSSDDTGEGTVSPASVTFTTANWDAPQTVTVTGVDDSLADGSQVFTIVTDAALSTDPGYATMNADDVEVTNTDNDSAGITVTPTSGLTTTEAGGEADFTIVLNSQPTADVTIALSSDDTGEGTVSPASVTFTTLNWNAPRTITVTGEDDSVADGNQVYSIVTGAASSSDSDYDGIDPPNVSVTNTDDDSPGITVAPTSGLVTTETGGTDSFTVVLNSQPSADVTIAVSSSDTGEGTVSTASLTFTTANWNAPQTVTVTGQPDATFDGDQPYTIVLGAASSTDTQYDGIDPTDVSVVNEDNDPGVTVSPTSGLVTTEAGATATFTVVLNTMPSSNVSVSVASGDASEVTVSPGSLTFTPTNWNAPQTVTLTGVDDAVADGGQTFTIVTGNSVSADLSYNGLPVADPTGTNEDDDSAGFQVTPTSLTVDESGTPATFQMRLRSQPTADVTVDIDSGDTSEGTVSPASLTFTTANWSAYQTVTVTGVDDFLADGNQVWTVHTRPASSTDGGYDGLNPANVSVTTRDDETVGFVVEPLDIITREDGTLTPTYRIRLTSQPTADVVVNVSSADTSEGTPSPTTLTFTDTNWNAFQTVTVTGEDDAVADGDQVYSIVNEPASSTDPGYDGLDPTDVAAVNIDNDSAGITVNPTTGLSTTEAGSTTTFTIVLNSQPTHDVTIGVSSDDTTEGTVSPASVTFTTTNWNAPQTITVTGVDDAVEDGDQTYLVRTAAATSSDPGYNGLNPADVSVTNQDDETAGFTVTPTSGLEVTEAGSTDTFTIVLNSQPTANVTVALSSNDTGEGTVSPSSVTFTPANWDAPQTVTVTGADDFLADGDQGWSVVTAVAGSADGNYNGVNPPDVSVTTLDDETPGVTVTPTSGLTTSEDGTVTDSFTIVLNSQPTDDVTIDLSVSLLDSDEGDVSPTSVTFTPVNWNAPQTVTVSGVDDFVADGNQVWTVQTSSTMSTGDADYAGLPVPDVTVTNVDDETAGVRLSRTSGLVTNEAGATDTFTVRLTSQPLNTVTIDVLSDDAGEGTASPSMLVFTPLNWDTPQTVTVTGEDDFVADGNQVYEIDLGPVSSADGDYDGMTVPSVSVTNLDDETPGITVTPTTGLVTSESGGIDTFDVVLNSQPTADVTIMLSGNPSEGTLDTTMLTFTSGNWNVAQTVTITGVDDSLADGNQVYLVVGDPSGSSDPDYAALSAFTVEVTNTDDD